MLLKECPMCGCKNMSEVADIGCKCNNCDEIFKYDDHYGINIVSLGEWKEYLDRKPTPNE